MDSATRKRAAAKSAALARSSADDDEVIVLSSNPVSHLRHAMVWGSACGVASAALIPYLLVIRPELAESAIVVSYGAVGLAAVTAVQNTAFSTLVSWIGLRTGEGFGLGAPYMARWLRSGEADNNNDQEANDDPKPRWLHAVKLGLACGVAIVALDCCFRPFMPE